MPRRAVQGYYGGHQLEIRTKSSYRGSRSGGGKHWRQSIDEGDVVLAGIFDGDGVLDHSPVLPDRGGTLDCSGGGAGGPASVSLLGDATR